MKSTQAMRDRIRQLMGREQDDYDRAVECVLDDLEGILGVAQGAPARGEMALEIKNTINRLVVVKERWDGMQILQGLDEASDAIATLYASPPATLPAGVDHPLGRLWKAIEDNSTDESFWMAEILLHEITKETGYSGYALPSTPRATPVMQAAENAAKVVEGWSDAKREYADRVTSAHYCTPYGREYCVMDGGGPIKRCPTCPHSSTHRSLGMKVHSDAAWNIARLYSYALASETRDLAGRIDVALEAERERCAKVAEAEAQTFLSPEYASNQPFGSLCERFACEQVAKAIRALAQPPAHRGDAAE